MAIIQIFGYKKCKNTQKAERFFKERRIQIQMIDLAEKELSKGELASVKSAVGLDNLLDKESKAYKDRGLEYMEFDAEDEILTDSRLYKTPIVRNGRLATAGYEPEVWSQWLSQSS